MSGPRQRDKKFLQAHVTIEDEGVFTTPWTATLTYAPGPDRIGEGVCAENRVRILPRREFKRSERPESGEAGLLNGNERGVGCKPINDP